MEQVFWAGSVRTRMAKNAIIKKRVFAEDPHVVHFDQITLDDEVHE